jgi:hypothetical protein
MNPQALGAQPPVERPPVSGNLAFAICMVVAFAFGLAGYHHGSVADATWHRTAATVLNVTRNPISDGSALVESTVSVPGLGDRTVALYWRTAAGERIPVWTKDRYVSVDKPDQANADALALTTLGLVIGIIVGLVGATQFNRWRYRRRQTNS